MSEQFVPLLKDNKDIHYRYKMPKLTTKVEGSGNGIKTVITNMTAIARSLNRPPSYPTKFFGCELGAQVTITKTDFIVNGSHDADKLLNLLYAFIKKFVLCTKCNNPETALKVIKNEIHQRCIACGKSTTIPKAMHRLTTFIINHPPNADTNGESTSASATTETTSGKSGKKSKSKKNNGGSSHSPNDSTDDKRASIVGGEGTAYGNGGADDDDGFDDEDLTIDASVERLENIQLGDEKICADLFHKYLTDKQQSGQLSDINVQKEILSEASRLNLKDKAALILSEVLFNEDIIKQIEQHRLLILRFLKEFPKGKKYFLGGFEKLVGDVYKDALLPKTSLILKAFYDNDILDEDTIFEWASKATKKYISKEVSKLIRDKANPFLKWLKEAEVEDESDGEEDEERVRDEKTTTNATNGKQATQKYENDDLDDEYDDDIDIEYSHRVDGLKVENKPANTTEDLGDLNIDDI